MPKQRWNFKKKSEKRRCCNDLSTLCSKLNSVDDTKNNNSSSRQEANMASKRSPGFRGINQVREDVISKLVEDN